MINRWWSLVSLLAIGAPMVSQAGPFEFIYADEITLRAPISQSWGITLAGTDFGLIVNKGATSLGTTELSEAAFRVRGVPATGDSTNPVIDPSIRPGINPGYIYYSGFRPIATDEAVGSVSAENALLTTLVGPGEVFRNSAPSQFIYFELRGSQNDPGIVPFDVRLRIGDQVATFSMQVTLIDSPGYSIEFTHAARVASTELNDVTEARTTTWGRLKSLYR